MVKNRCVRYGCVRYDGTPFHPDLYSVPQSRVVDVPETIEVCTTEVIEAWGASGTSCVGYGCAKRVEGGRRQASQEGANGNGFRFIL